MTHIEQIKTLLCFTFFKNQTKKREGGGYFSYRSHGYEDVSLQYGERPYVVENNKHNR